MQADYEYLKHTADAEFIAYGRTLEGSFVNAARATFNLIVEPEKVKPSITKEIEVSGDELDYLLYDWISELLFLFEVENLVFSKFEVSISREGESYHLKGLAYGEKIDQERHNVALHIKAVTFHDLRVEKINNFYESQVLLDI